MAVGQAMVTIAAAGGVRGVVAMPLVVWSSPTHR